MGRDAEPYLPGNTASMKAGVWSERRVDPVVVELMAGVLDRRGDLARWPEALSAWARAEARLMLLEEHLAVHGFETADGKPSISLKYVASWARVAADARARLGLDPQSEAQLVRTQAEAAREVVDIESIRDRGRAALKARRRA